MTEHEMHQNMYCMKMNRLTVCNNGIYLTLSVNVSRLRFHRRHIVFLSAQADSNKYFYERALRSRKEINVCTWLENI